MDNHWFFRTLWRFNALLIAGGAFLIGSLILWEFAIQPIFAPDRPTEVTISQLQPQEDEPTHRVVFGNTIQDGSGNFLVQVVVDNNSRSVLNKSRRNYENALNIGIHTSATNQTNWIFPTNKQLITDFTTVREPGSGAPGKTLGFLITYVDQDTDQNDSLSKADNKSLLAIRSDGSSPNLLMQNLKNTPTTIHSSSNAQEILILLREGSDLTLSQFNRSTFTLGPQQSIQLP